jgi:pyruvate, water dikinase
MPKMPGQDHMNVGNPELAFEFQRLPNAGVGLARLEFIIARMIGVHPKAVLAYPNLPADLKRRSSERSAGYPIR